MDTVKVSETLYKLYGQDDRVINYTLGELLGMTDYKKCAGVDCVPLKSDDTNVDIHLNQTVFSELESNFVQVKDFSAIVEVLLWNNYFMGMDL